MKRASFAAIALVLLLAVIWVAGPLLQGDAVYEVKPGVGLVLSIQHPGLFVDLLPAPDGADTQGGNLRPWPGADRRRFITLFRGPFEQTVAPGDGPFDLANLPGPAVGGVPGVRLPEGWRQVGHYAGRFAVTDSTTVPVAMPAGMAGGAEATEKVRKLYLAAETLFGRPPVREKVAVVIGPEPIHLGEAVAELWVPQYPADVHWLETGATQYYAVKLLDQAKIWSETEKNKWLRQHATDKGYAIAIWLDATLRLDKVQKVSLNDLLVKTQGNKGRKEILAAVNALGGLMASDHLDRMLKGQEPLPVTK